MAINTAPMNGNIKKNTPTAEILCVIEAFAVIGNLIFNKFKKRGGLDIFKQSFKHYIKLF